MTFFNAYYTYKFNCNHVYRQSGSVKDCLDMKKKIRKDSHIRAQKRAESGWTEVDVTKHVYETPEYVEEEEYTLLTRGIGETLLGIFLTFVPIWLLRRVWDDGNVPGTESWTIKRGAKRNPTVLSFSPSRIYKVLAVSIRMVGTQDKPTENVVNDRPLRESIVKESSYFDEKYPEKGKGAPYINILELLIARFLFHSAYFDDISKLFQSIVTRLGVFVAGDEKLLHFTGNSGICRLILSKPDRIGLWFYELCCQITGGLPFLLYLRLWDSVKSSKDGHEAIPVSEIVKEWSEVVRRLNVYSILAADSYYFDTTSRQYCNDPATFTRYISSVEPGRFAELVDLVKFGVTTSGKWAGVWNEQSKELFVHNWSLNIGKKYMLSNAYTRKAKRYGDKWTIPGYDLYALIYGFCDRFNRALKDRKWPFRHGGNTACGDKGCQHNFALSCILQNTFNVYRSFHMKDLGVSEDSAAKEKYIFQEYCYELADQLFEYANTLE